MTSAEAVEETQIVLRGASGIFCAETEKTQKQITAKTIVNTLNTFIFLNELCIFAKDCFPQRRKSRQEG